MAQQTERNIQSGHLLMGGLGLCLAAVIGLFLHSEYSTPPSTGENTVSLDKGNATTAKSTQQTATSDSQAAPDTTVQGTQAQPDKSLPIPAHQLKKLIAEEKSTDSLDDKIAAANQAIAQLDKQLPQAADTSATIEASTTPDQKSQELDDRIQHIRDHLKK